MTLGLSGAGKEVLAGLGLKGGGVVCGGSPWVFLPLPLLLFFLAEPAAQETSFIGLPPGGLTALDVVVGLTKGPPFHSIYCCQTLRAFAGLPYLLITSMPSFTRPARME